MSKSKPDSKWLDYFAKLGVYSKVQVLCDNQDTDVMEIETVGDSGIIQEDGASGGDVTEIVAGNINTTYFTSDIIILTKCIIYDLT